MILVSPAAVFSAFDLADRLPSFFSFVWDGRAGVRTVERREVCAELQKKRGGDRRKVNATAAACSPL